MAISPTSNVNSPISADLMYQFYDNKAITPQIRAALQKRQDAEDAANALKSGSDPSSKSDPLKPGPATRVNITDQIIRMNIANNTTKKESKEETPETPDAAAAKKKPYRYDVLEEVKKSVAAREAEAKKAKDAQLKEIADKVAADEAAKKKAEEESQNPATPNPDGSATSEG